MFRASREVHSGGADPVVCGWQVCSFLGTAGGEPWNPWIPGPVLCWSGQHHSAAAQKPSPPGREGPWEEVRGRHFRRAFCKNPLPARPSAQGVGVGVEGEALGGRG